MDGRVVHRHLAERNADCTIRSLVFVECKEYWTYGFVKAEKIMRLAGLIRL